MNSLMLQFRLWALGGYMSSFPSIRIEGGLLGPELLDQVIAADVPGQKPARLWP